jgi:ribosomal protein S24E
MLVLHHYDTNAILVEPLKTRHGNEILRGYTKLYTHLTKRGFKPTTHWLDNEALNALKTFNRT